MIVRTKSSGIARVVSGGWPLMALNRRLRKAATVGDGQIDFVGIYRAAARIDRPIFNVECEGGPGVDLTREAGRSLEHLRPLGWTLTA